MIEQIEGSLKCALIINPTSGTRSKDGVAQYVVKRLYNKGINVEVYTTHASGDAYSLALQSIDNGCNFVIVAGGDGTVNEVANALTNTHVPLGIIPLGSGNGLARSLNIPGDLQKAIDIIEEGYVRTCDNGVINGKNFFCTCGIGFDAWISEKFANVKRRGKTAYINNVIKEFISYNPQTYAIAIEGNVIVEKAFLIAICNAPQYGNNAYIAPSARLDDGLLDIIVVHTGNIIKNALIGVDLFTGYINHNTMIDSFRIPNASISRLDEGPVHLDGEPYSMGKLLDIKCNPASLKLFTPKYEKHFQPFITPIQSFLLDIRYDIRAKLNIK